MLTSIGEVVVKVSDSKNGTANLGRDDKQEPRSGEAVCRLRPEG